MTRSVARIRLSITCSSRAVLLHAPCVFAQQAKPDNTEVNKADRAPSQPTADQQKNNTSDLDLTRTIRRAIMADRSLSTYAHNVKIITQNGKVTLRDLSVRMPKRHRLKPKPPTWRGHANVTNEVSVTPAKSATKKPVS